MTKMIGLKFIEQEDEDYCRDTFRNIKLKILAENKEINNLSYATIVKYLCVFYNNGHDTGIKNPEAVKTEKVRDFYEEPDEKERIRRIVNKKDRSFQEQSELWKLSEALKPETGGKSIENVTNIIKTYYLQPESEPEFELEFEPEPELEPETKTVLKPMEATIMEMPSTPEIEAYWCGECRMMHFSRGNKQLFATHREFETEYIEQKTTENIVINDNIEIMGDEFVNNLMSNSNNAPYKCTKCNKTHRSGKIYEEHKQYKEAIVKNEK